MKNLLTIFIVFCVLVAQAQTIRYVKPTATGTGTGASWTNASANLQSMINASAAGDEVWVTAGTYKPASYPMGATNPVNNRDYAFFVKDGVKLFGSFAGTETAITQRNIASNRSILSANIGTLTTNGDNCYHILIAIAPPTNGIGVTVDGFDMVDAYAWGSPTATSTMNINSTVTSKNAGGAMLLYRGVNTIANNTIYNNYSQYYGGAIYVTDATNHILNNTIHHDYAAAGGAIYSIQNTNYITNNTMYNNTSSSDSGGSIYSENDINSIFNNTIFDNKAYNWGGGIYTLKGTNTLQNNTFYQNTAYNGGGLLLNGGAHSLVNNTIYDNHATIQGGGMYIVDTSAIVGTGTSTLTNNIFWKNNIGVFPDTSYTQIGSDFIKNPSIIDLTANNNMFQLDSLAYNAILKNNFNAASSGNKFQQNPLFSNENNLLGADGIARTADDGLRLCTNSIGINTGTTSGTNIPTTDITGATRTGNPDIGAYEGGIGTCTVIPTAALIRYVKPTAAGTGDGSSWANASSDLQGMINYVSLNGANSPKQVWVAAGTYYPTQDVNGNTAVAGATFLIKPAVRLYGGFAGTETNLNQRNSEVNITILNADAGVLNDGVFCSRVVTMGSVSNFTLIDGFRITASQESGIYCTPGYAVITNNHFYKNRRGITVAQGTAYIGNNFIYNNEYYNFNSDAREGSASIYNYLGNTTIVNNVIYKNAATWGGGMCSWGGTNYVTNNTFYANSAGYGGGFAAQNNANNTFINNVFQDNLVGNNAALAGADIYTTTTSVFKNNSLQLAANQYTTGSYNALSAGSTNNIFQQNLYLLNAGFVKGHDGLYKTTDDGLRPCANSSLVNTGLAATATNGVPPLDITGTTRTTADIGAYQSSATACNGEIVSYRFIKPTATGTGDGTSWRDASNDISTMITDVGDNGIGRKEVWVKAGTYKPTKQAYPNSSSGDARKACFYVYGNVHLYGGFTGSETLRDLRNATTNTTILDGNIGSVGTHTDNVYHVVIIQDILKKGATIDGFHIINGYSNGPSVAGIDVNGYSLGNGIGAGICAVWGNNTISNNKIYNNTTLGVGAGVFSVKNKAYITGNSIYNNKSISVGGNGGSAIFVTERGGRDTIIGNIIRDNTGEDGAGIYIYQDSTYITKNAIYNNVAARYGGGILAAGGSYTNIHGNMIYNNIAAHRGGGIEGGYAVTNNLIVGNTCTYYGGGGLSVVNTGVTVNNNTFVGNWSKQGLGGGIYSDYGVSLLNNNIFWANKTGNTPSIFAVGADYGKAINTFGNTPDVLRNNMLQLASTDYSVAGGNDIGNTATNIFQYDPLFVNPTAINGADNLPFTADDGFRLHTNSLALDAGIAPDATNFVPTTDILGNPRNSTPDIGAYEGGFQNALLLANMVRYVGATPSGSADGSSWANRTTDLQGAIDYLNLNTTGTKQVWVKKGTYTPTRDHLGNSNPTNQRTKTFHLKSDIELYGGFLGTETTLALRNPTANTTILSGDIGTANNNTDNAYHVLLASCRNPQKSTNALAAGITIDGFSILDGNANSPISLIIRGDTIRPTYGGGAICLSYGSNRIANNRIYNNATSTNGGAIYLTNSINNIKNNAFYTNTATINGGAIASLFATDTVVNNVFHTNSSNLGGAVCVTNNTNNFINNTFYLNNATTNGGAIAVLGNTSHRFKNNIFWDNTKNNANNVANADFYSTATATFYNNCLQLPITNYTAANNNLLAANSTANLFQQNPLFKNTADIDGADNLISTPDDGLRVCVNSIAFNTGASGADVPTTDLLNAPRIGNPELGAYEGDGCSFINTETNNADYNTITAYPNPSATGVFTIKGTSNANQQIVVTNALGQILHTTLRDNMLYLDHLPQGIYFINFIADKQFVKVISL